MISSAIRGMTRFLKLVRAPNLIIIIFTQYLVKAVIIDKSLSLESFQNMSFNLLVLSTVLTASGGYIINDYFDVKIDLVNKPHKTLVGRFFSRRIALAWHLILTTIGIALGFYNGLVIGLVHVLSALLLWIYSSTLKKIAFVGNIVVALLTALSIFMVAILFQEAFFHVLIYALFAFYISLIREIIKDIEDLKGDESFGCKTLPILLGIRKTKKIIQAAIVLFILNIAFFFPVFSSPMLFYMVGMAILPLFFLVFRLEVSDTLKDYRFLSLFCKLIMISGMGSILFFL